VPALRRRRILRARRLRDSAGPGNLLARGTLGIADANTAQPRRSASPSIHPTACSLPASRSPVGKATIIAADCVTCPKPFLLAISFCSAYSYTVNSGFHVFLRPFAEWPVRVACGEWGGKTLQPHSEQTVAKTRLSSPLATRPFPLFFIHEALQTKPLRLFSCSHRGV